ncbi:Uncharacterised protein [Enterobacter cloacae]|uniref:Uncharacterized protein n=1 Tax=Enterobacter cloacae TaxID=550 RepID=A0A377M9Z3_ENTCL|nr:Uncharacterised protein [Enterobacter cloacae]
MNSLSVEDALPDIDDDEDRMKNVMCWVRWRLQHA